MRWNSRACSICEPSPSSSPVTAQAPGLLCRWLRCLSTASLKLSIWVKPTGHAWAPRTCHMEADPQNPQLQDARQHRLSPCSPIHRIYAGLPSVSRWSQHTLRIWERIGANTYKCKRNQGGISPDMGVFASLIFWAFSAQPDKIDHPSDPGTAIPMFLNAKVTFDRKTCYTFSIKWFHFLHFGL